MSNIVVIGVYAPSQGHRNPTPKQFREELQKVLDYLGTTYEFIHVRGHTRQ
jgi:hypothetical protein